MGRKAFVSRAAAAARAAAAESDGSDEEKQKKTSATKEQAEASSIASADAKPAVPAAPAAPAAAPSASRGSDNEEDEDGPSAGGRETRGQMVQRHKRELKAQKEASKRLGKKKDEVAAAEAALAARHAAELKSLEDEEESAKGNGNAAAAAAAADSLSRFKLDGDDKDSKKELPTLRKGSKAARKRAERLAADAEREARRDSERAAAAGTGAGSLEAKELKATVLRPLGLEVFDVPADGHCLYAALSHQLEQAKKLRRKQNEEEGGGGHEEGGEGGDNNSSTSCSSDFSVKSLRALAARHIREHASAFEPFIDDEELLEGEGEQERTEQGEGGGGTETSKVERYCRRLEGTAAWGGQPELQALASSLPATIKVLSVGMEPVVVEGEGGNKGPELRICYLRHAFGLGEHYNSTVAKGKGGEIDSNSDESEGEGEGEAEEEEEKDGE